MSTASFGNIPPFYTSAPPATNTTTTAFTGGAWTFTRTHVDSSAETIVTFKLDEDTSSLLTIENGDPTNAVFLPQLRGTHSGTSLALILQGRGTTDTGSTAVVRFDSRIGASTAVVTRPPFEWTINGNTRMRMLSLNSGANSCLSWLTLTGAAPAFTTRSAGTRLVLYEAITGSKVDNAIGVAASGADNWYSVQEATSSYSHKFYGGQTQLALLRGDGVLNLGTNTTLYSRLGQKLETNTSAANGGAALNTWDSATGTSLFDFNRSKSSTIGTHTVVASGDELGRVTFRGSDGSVFREAGSIRGAVDGTPGSSDMPGRLTFWTTPDGSATESERMRITNAGDVGIGKTPTTGIILDVNGQLGLKSYTVATLPSAAVQAGAIVYVSDAGGNGPCIAVSNGTNWKRCDNTGTTVT